MKKFRYLVLIILSIILIGTGCHVDEGVSEAQPEANDTVVQDTTSPKSKELTIWTYENGIASVIEKYKTKNANIDIKLNTFAYDKAQEAYMKALAEGTTPDIFIIDSTYWGQYVGTEALQDLLEEPFYAGKLKKDFPESLWNIHKSIDGEKVLALPIATSPRVTFYRADIMEQNGFPSDPEELGKFMEDPANWLEIAKKLKKNDQYIIQWTNDPIEILGTTVSVFDKELKFQRNTDMFIKGIDLAKELHKYALESNIGLWSELGKSAINSGKLSMFYMGPWAVDLIEEYSPAAKGKWRVTRLPFGQYGWSATTSIAMNGQSTNKEAAWDFIKYTVTHKDMSELNNTVPGYIPARKKVGNLERGNEFLGGQKVYAMYEKLTEKMKEYELTPLDDRAVKILRDGVLSAVENDTDSRESMSKITEKIYSELADDRRILLDYMGK